MLADLRQRAAGAKNATKSEISREAQRAGDVLFAACSWALAHEFYMLAYASALWDKDEIGRRLLQCRRRSRHIIADDREVYSGVRVHRLDETPNVDALDLPYIWADLGRLHCTARYFKYASEAAVAVNDTALADWARRKAEEFAPNEQPLSQT